MPKKPKVKPLSVKDRSLSTRHLGEHVCLLVFPGDMSVDDHRAKEIGLAIRMMLKAGLKATITGRQTNKQITASLDSAVKAANRYLTRVLRQKA